MSIKVKAVERELKVGASAGQYRFMMQTELYNKLSQSKVIQEAALRSGISKGAINATWDAIGEVIKAWATEGHSVAIPGLGPCVSAFAPPVLKAWIWSAPTLSPPAA